MKKMLITGICWCCLVVLVSSQAEIPLPFPSIPSPTPCPVKYKRDFLISESSNASTPTTATPQWIDIPDISQSTASTPSQNLTLGTRTFTPAPAETVFVFSGDILAESHSITLLFTSKTCTQNPVVSITASVTTLPHYGVNSDGVTVGTTHIRCMVFGSGSRSSTYSAQGTGGWGSGMRGLVWTFTDRLIHGQTTQNPWQSGTALWINPIPTTLPRYVVSNQTVAFNGTATFQSAGGNVQASITTDSKGSGWIVAGSTSDTVPGWPLITPGPVAGSDLGGDYPYDDRAPGGAALIETGCCSICQNATQTTTTSTKSGASWSRGSALDWRFFLLVWTLVQL